MRKKAILLFLLSCIQVCVLSAQDTTENQQSSEPNITEQSQKTIDDADKITSEPNTALSTQESSTDNNSSSLESKTAEAARSYPEKAKGKEPSDPWRIVPWIIAAVAAIFGPVGGWLFTLYRYRRRVVEEEDKEQARLRAGKEFGEVEEKRQSQTLEDRYKKTLREELGWVRMLGSPDIPNLPVHLLDTFVSLHISETWRSEMRFDPREEVSQQEREQNLTPEQIIRRAFVNRRMLLIIGDPGSGKTTLMKYYAMCCMSPDRCKLLGFDQPLLPIYFPLRQVRSDGEQINSLSKNLAQWADEHALPMDEKWFDNQFNQSPTLVLLDGLDEISNPEMRRSVCDWIDNTASGLNKVKFIVTSRWTGYRKSDQIELGFPHIRADIRDFSAEQQAEFLQKWFCAAFLEEQRDDSIERQDWEERQKNRGLKRAQVVIDFLREDKNKGVQELAAIPMLLQIIAVIWKAREVLPTGRAELYQIAIKYLLDYRDRRRKLNPLMEAMQAFRVLSPVSLWMQEELRADEVEKDELHTKMQPIINTINDKLTAEAFCENLRDRAGLIADYGESAYIFRHKSFREYLTALELVDDSKRNKKRLKKVVKYFGDDWWEEPMRFFINEADDRLFDKFMDALFTSDVSKELDQKQQNLLHTIVSEASQVRIDSLVKRLNDGRVTDTKKRYILDCLKTIDREEARVAVREFAAKRITTAVGAYAQEIASVAASEEVTLRDAVKVEISLKTEGRLTVSQGSFRNPFEYNTEYIRIPGGQYEYSVTKKTETVSDIHFAKYPVTNKRYRRFIRYLAGEDEDLRAVLPFNLFSERILDLTGTIKGFKEYIGAEPQQWAEKLRSRYDQEKRFKGDDQPVVGVSWFAARFYCFWLSALEEASRDSASGGGLYRLASEVEWEWAAGGGSRGYPWGDEEPDDKLANYEGNVGATTPVGRYPDGATPEGLMDMAGNVWEWMENWHEDYNGQYRCLRGGSWLGYENSLRCTERDYYYPGNRNDAFGFRVVRSQS